MQNVNNKREKRGENNSNMSKVALNGIKHVK